jgi:two-component system response regulator AtoC
MSGKVLIIDDEKTFRVVAQTALQAEGYEVEVASSARHGQEQARLFHPDVVILDRSLPDADGLTVLEKLNGGGEEGPLVIMATAYAEVDNAVQALKSGAFDYLTKPLQLPDLLLTIRKALDARRLRKRAESFSGIARRRLEKELCLGESAGMRRVVELAEKVAASPQTTVLVEGESGSGKELVAQLIHLKTPVRGEAPLVEINCAAIPETLLESELFGHERGAFTDAKQSRPGLLERAEGGSLFLDEIGDMPLATQTKLLRVLETQVFRRLGGSRDMAADVRFIAATHRDLDTAVDSGNFRLDLLHRLDVFRIRVPPLRERREDILPLARFFLEKLASGAGKTIAGLLPEAEQRLLSYNYPGNVRELRNVIERAVILESGELLGPDSLLLRHEGSLEARRISSSMPIATLPVPGPAGPSKGTNGHHAVPGGDSGPGAPPPWHLSVEGTGERPPTLEELERAYLVDLLERAQGNRSQVARWMGVSYPTVAKKISDYAIDLGRWKT